MAEFGTRDGEELRLVLTGPHDTSSPDDYTVLPHTGQITGLERKWQRGDTGLMDGTLQVLQITGKGFTVPVQWSSFYMFGLWDSLFQMILGNPWSAPVSITGANIASEAGKLTALDGTFDALAADVPCMVWLKRDGATPIAQPVLALGVSSSPGELLIADSSNFGVDLTSVLAGDNVTVMHSGVLRNGVTPYYAMIEQAAKQLGHYYVAYGLALTKLDVTQQRGQDTTLSFQGQAVDATNATATFGTGSETRPTLYPPFNGGSDVQFFGEGGRFSTFFSAATGKDIVQNSLAWSIESGAIPTVPMGADGPYHHEKGTVKLSGSFGLMQNQDGRDVYNQSQNAAADSSLHWMNRTVDEDGTARGYCWYLPRIEYMETSRKSGDDSNQASVDLNWMARVGADGFTVKVTRLDGFPQ